MEDKPGYVCLDTISIELVSVTGGVRPVPYVLADPEYHDNYVLSKVVMRRTELTSRQYHRVRWKVLQKMIGKK